MTISKLKMAMHTNTSGITKSGGFAATLTAVDTCSISGIGHDIEPQICWLLSEDDTKVIARERINGQNRWETWERRNYVQITQFKWHKGG